MGLRDLDLNLLVVFNQLMQESRVNAVARSLGITQPAVSNALRRLRRHLGDELFLRTSRGMVPTPFAVRLAEPVASALATLQSALRQRAAFDPATSTRTFVVAMTDIGEIYFLPPLMDALARIAPHVCLSTVRAAGASLKDDMEAGAVDLALGLLPDLKAGFFQRRLFRHRYVCMFRSGHPLDKRRITLAEFSAADHVVVVAAGTGHGRVDAMLDDAGIRRRVRLRVPHFVAVGHILRETDMVATVPERFAQRCAGPFGLAYVAHPAKLPEIAINQFWHARFHREPGNQWLRGVVAEQFLDQDRSRGFAPARAGPG
ncbi:MAG: LysR family transcriptional regulator [Betaproteobacteria bacterium]|nr:LysR family transcriptional regulator [Betaproteobacteria bacterium]